MKAVDFKYAQRHSDFRDLGKETPKDHYVK